MRLPPSVRRLIPRAELGVGVVRRAWDALAPLPGGKAIFSRIIGRAAPYTGSIGASVVELREGFAKVEMRDRPGLRNHLRSLHAVALANLVEVTGNIALSYSMPPRSRFIVSKMEIHYEKKARGTIIATSICPVPTSNERETYEVPVELRDLAGEIVVRGTLTSLVGPAKGAESAAAVAA